MKMIKNMLFFDMKRSRRIFKEASAVMKLLLTREFMLFQSVLLVLFKYSASFVQNWPTCDKPFHCLCEKCFISPSSCDTWYSDKPPQKQSLRGFMQDIQLYSPLFKSHGYSFHEWCPDKDAKRPWKHTTETCQMTIKEKQALFWRQWETQIMKTQTNRIRRTIFPSLSSLCLFWPKFLYTFH